MHAWDAQAGLLLVEEAGGRAVLPYPARRASSTAVRSSRQMPCCSMC